MSRLRDREMPARLRHPSNHFKLVRGEGKNLKVTQVTRERFSFAVNPDRFGVFLQRYAQVLDADRYRSKPGPAIVGGVLPKSIDS